jgi:hypothetical protein
VDSLAYLRNKRPVIGAFRKIPRKVAALYGGAFVVVMLLVWALSQQGNWYERDAANRSRHYARDAEGQIADRCSFLPTVDQPKCVDETVLAARSNQREEQDLAAQKVTAWWTRAMGVAAILGMVLSVFGVFLVFFTFGETRRANILNMRENARSTRRSVVAAQETSEALIAASKTAEAAAAQVEIAQENSYRELRAYLSFEDVEVVFAGQNFLKGHIFIKNAGKTPATVRIFLGRWIGPHPLPAIPAEAPEPGRMVSHGPFINANCRDKLDWFYPRGDQTLETEAAIANLSSPNFALYVYGRVEFVDFRRRRRVLNLCFRNHGTISPVGECKIEMVPTAYGNGYRDEGIEEA